MCGIAGMVALSAGDRLDAAVVRRMCDLQVHRGPDDSGLWASSDGRVVLGHRRLSIIDLSASGRQPMETADGRFRVVFNGEIYNFAALRAELEQAGHVFRSTSDTEVILHGYREWGRGLLDRLGGMFAFALHDVQQDELLLARDPLGIKPLYWGLEAGDMDGRGSRRLAFASEVQALRKVMPSGGTDPEAVAHYLMWGSIAPPRTLYRRFRALAPGHYLVVRRGDFKNPEPYFQLVDYVGQVEPMDRMEALAYARGALRDSVERHLVADVEVGAFLSGGVDSSALVGLASEFHDSPITTVNMSFGDHPLDEAPLAEEAARLYGTRHHRVPIELDDARDRIRDAVLALDQPSVDGVNVYFVSEAAVRAGLKVALSGVGGDELFAGYASFQMIPSILDIHEKLSRIPGLSALRRPLAAGLRATSRRTSVHNYALALEYGDTYTGAYFAQRGLDAPSHVRGLLAKDCRDAVLGCPPVTELDARVASLDVPVEERISLLELQQYMGVQLLRDADVMSMSHSLEVRTPLVDRELVCALFRIPAEHRHAGPAKLLLREAPARPVPDALWARTKQGFTMPFEDWLRSGELPVALPKHPIFDGDALRVVERDFRAGRTHWSRVWALLVLEPFLD